MGLFDKSRIYNAAATGDKLWSKPGRRMSGVGAITRDDLATEDENDLGPNMGGIPAEDFRKITGGTNNNANDEQWYEKNKFTNFLFGPRKETLPISADGIPEPVIKKPSLFGQIANVALPALYSVGTGNGLLPGLMAGTSVNTSADRGATSAAADDYMKRLYQKDALDLKKAQLNASTAATQAKVDLGEKDTSIDWQGSPRGRRYFSIERRMISDPSSLTDAEMTEWQGLRTEAKKYGY